jgi:hypothetical protein
MLSVGILYSDLAVYQYQSFRCDYDFIWRERRVRLDFQEIVLTIPEFAFRKDAKLIGLGPIDHFQKLDRSAMTFISFLALLSTRRIAPFALHTAMTK